MVLGSDRTLTLVETMSDVDALLVLKDGQVSYRGKLPEDPDAVIAELVR